MQKFDWKPYAGFIALSEAAGGLSALITKQGMEAYQAVAKPSLTPPGIVFPIVWAVLYALMGAGAARVYNTCPDGNRTRAIRIYLGQLLVNFFWSIFFFNLRAWAFSFFWLVLLIALAGYMTRFFAFNDKTAAWLQAPYLTWLLFALYLNGGVWLLNR